MGTVRSSQLQSDLPRLSLLLRCPSAATAPMPPGTLVRIATTLIRPPSNRMIDCKPCYNDLEDAELLEC